jgi:hypothetical protein
MIAALFMNFCAAENVVTGQVIDMALAAYRYVHVELNYLARGALKVTLNIRLCVHTKPRL